MVFFKFYNYLHIVEAEAEAKKSKAVKIREEKSKVVRIRDDRRAKNLERS